MTVAYSLLTSSPSPSWVHSLCLGLVVLIVIVVLLALVDRWVSVQRGLREGFFSERIVEIPIQLVPDDVMFITEEQQTALMKTVHPTKVSSSSVMVTTHMTLTKMNTVCQTEGFQGCVGIGLNNITFEQVVFFKDKETINFLKTSDVLFKKLEVKDGHEMRKAILSISATTGSTVLVAVPGMIRKFGRIGQPGPRFKMNGFRRKIASLGRSSRTSSPALMIMVKKPQSSSQSLRRTRNSGSSLVIHRRARSSTRKVTSASSRS